VNALDTRRLVELIKEYKIDITCNACNCYTNDSVLEACCEAGSHYIDMAADFYSPPGVRRPGKASYEYEVEKYHQRYLDKGLAGILCMGMDPGAVNVFARWAMDRLDTATSIRVLDADNAEVRGYRFAVLFSPETFFEELGATPYYIKDGKLRSGKPLETEVEWIRFPDPIGLQKTYAVAHEEGVSLGLYPPFVEKGVRYSVFKYSLSDKIVGISKTLQLLNLDTWKKVKVDGVEVAPVRVASANLPKPAQLGATVEGYSCVGTEVRGTRDRRRVEYFIYSMDSHRDTYERYGYSLTLVQTGIPPALAARLLATGTIQERGVMMPEALDPEPFMDNFSREGLPIFVERREVERL
jgi:saccharopine dehydrogenase (NAD+, L-lysine-forming)